MPILLLNAGSSSLKLTILDQEGNKLADGEAGWAGESTRYQLSGLGVEIDQQVDWRGHADAVRRFHADLSEAAPQLLKEGGLLGVGHRVVHGGDFTEAMRITPEVRQRLEQLTPLAPLHNPGSLATLDVAQELLPHLPHIACFDTAFHTTMIPAAKHYAIPQQWSQEWGIRRYGFHGLSHAYCTRRATELLGNASPRLVICHLGHGCSASAVARGKCVETSMGFTPLDGLMMATRSGSVDPGALFYLQRMHGLSADEMDHALNRQSGLLGVSGVSADMREVLAATRSGQEQATLAFQMFCHRVRAMIGSFTVTLGGIDALVFTAGIGEHAHEVRAEICRNLACLGLHLDAERNRTLKPDADIATPDSPARILLIHTREDLTMLREVLQVLGP